MQMTQDVQTREPALSPQDVDGIVARRGEPDWLADRRREALRCYETMDFPDPNDEEWRRTDVRAMTFDGLQPYAAATAVASVDELPEPLRAASADERVSGRLVQQDSDVVHTSLAEDLRKQGVILTDLHTAAREHANLVRERLYGVVKPDEWKYLALNAAAWSGGCFLYVPKGVEVELPIHLVTGVISERIAVFPRALVVVGPQAKLTLIDEAVSPQREGKTLVSGAVEVYVGDGSHVEYYSVNGWGGDVYNFNTVRAIVGRDAQFVTLAAGLGGKVTKMRADTEMPQSGATAKLLGVTFADRDQHFDYNTLQNHIGAHTVSDLQFKSALKDHASLVWYGITRINPTASASEANQVSRNLLLSEHAKAAPIPILEIQAYDVAKCSHGATAGPVDEDELFYMQARAIPRKTAEQMLIEGFLADVVDRIPNETLRERVRDSVLAKAGGVPETEPLEELLGA